MMTLLLKSSSPAEPDFDLLGTQPQWEKLSGFDEATHDPVSNLIHSSQSQKGNTAREKSEIRDQV